MVFFNNTALNKPGVSQYSEYLENKFYLQDLKKLTNDPTNYQLLSIRRALAEGLESNRTSISNLTSSVCGTLEDGFKAVADELQDVNWRLNEIQGGIEELNVLFDRKSDMIIEEQKITNLYLGNISNLLRIPDSQIQRSYHVEQGLLLLKNAFEEGSRSGYYTDAMDEFTKAINIEERDYFSLCKLGFIHVNSLNHLDEVKAQQYFLTAARYFKVAATAAEFVSHRLNDVISKEELIYQTAYCYNMAAYCSYINGDITKAVEYARQACQLQQSNKFSYDLARYLAKSSDVSSAIKLLIEIIEQKDAYFVKALEDPEFQNNEDIISSLQRFAEKFIAKIEDDLKEINSAIIHNSGYTRVMQEINALFKTKTYLNARRVDRRLRFEFEGKDVDLYQQIQSERDRFYKSLVYEEQKRKETEERIRNEALAKKQEVITSVILAIVCLVIAYFFWRGSLDTKGGAWIIVISISVVAVYAAFALLLAKDTSRTERLRGSIEFSGPFTIAGILGGGLIGFFKGCGHSKDISGAIDYAGESIDNWVWIIAGGGLLIFILYKIFEKK